MSILMAIRLPDTNTVFLPEKATPVNLLRLLFNHSLNTEFDMFPEQSFFSTWSSPYDFVNVTAKLDSIEPARDALVAK